MMTHRAFAAALLAVALVGAAVAVSDAQISPDVVEQVIARTVLLITLVRDKGQEGKLAVFGQCSGAFVTPGGLILTASHCVRATEDLPKVGIKQGQLFTPEGLLGVSVTVPDQPRPVLAMIAKYVADNPDLDIALVKVDALIGAGTDRPLPQDFRVPVVAIGDSDTVRHGEPVAIVGFPGVGGETVTVNQGYVAGFLADAQGRKTIMKLDAQGGRGASGGPVINARGEEVAIVSHVMYNVQAVERSLRATLTNRLPSAWAQYLRAPAPGPATGPARESALIQGRVVDAGTGAGISGAGVFVLRPGASPWAAVKEDILSSAYTDGTGQFQTRPPVPRGATYPVVIMVSGYQGVAGDLELAPTGSEVFSIGKIQLQRQQ